MEARKRRGGLVDYDDWQVLLRDALVHPDHGEMACGRIRDRFRVVLVDEFQDTDPVQWEILRTAFHGSSTLVLIGDPKQAIYAFRGGDVMTYLQAAAVASRQETLTRNWRSDAGLLGALEQLFGGAALGDPRIVVRPVDAAHPSPRLDRRRGAAADPAGGAHRARPARARAPPGRPGAGGGRRGRRRRRGRPAAAGRPGCTAPRCSRRDVAVLVRTNLQGRMIRDALTAAGVPATLAGGGSVFTTPAARAWLVLLEAVEQPHRPGGSAPPPSPRSSGSPRPPWTPTATPSPTGSAPGCGAGPTCSPTAASPRCSRRSAPRRTCRPGSWRAPTATGPSPTCGTSGSCCTRRSAATRSG